MFLLYNVSDNWSEAILELDLEELFDSFDSWSVTRTYISIFNYYSTFWMCLGSFLWVQILKKNVLDSDFWTSRLFIKGFQMKDIYQKIVKDCWIHLQWNFYRNFYWIGLDLNSVLKEVFF